MSRGERTLDAPDLVAPPPYIASMHQIESYEEVDEILKSADFVQGSHRETGALIAGSLVMVDGEEHMNRRRVLSGLMSRAALEHYELQALEPQIARVIEDLRARLDADGVVRGDLVEMVSVMQHRITALVSGIDGVDTAEGIERFRWFGGQLGEAVSSEWTTGDRDEIIRRGLELRAKFVAEFVRPSFERRKALVTSLRAGRTAKGNLPTDLLTSLILNWNPDWTEDYVWCEATLFLVAAIETTTHALPHMVKELADWLAHHPEDRGKVTDPHFLWLVANEALRLHVPVPSLQRIAARDVTLSSGRQFRAGDRVALMFSAANREPDLFGPDAGTFNPHRKFSQTVRPWGLTFGGGTHLCLGRPLITGTSKRTGDDASTTQGTLVRMLRALYAAGLELDPDRPPVRNQREYRGYYESMPVILRGA